MYSLVALFLLSFLISACAEFQQRAGIETRTMSEAAVKDFDTQLGFPECASPKRGVRLITDMTQGGGAVVSKRCQ